MELSYKEILEVQEQVYPFLLIDHIDEVIPGKSAKGYKYLNMNDWFFQYHYPNEPLMPGVLLIEAIGQLITIVISTLPGMEKKRAYLTNVENTRFYKQVEPCGILHMETEIMSYTRGVVRSKGICRIENEIVCQTNLTHAVPEILDQFKVGK